MSRARYDMRLNLEEVVSESNSPQGRANKPVYIVLHCIDVEVLQVLIAGWQRHSEAFRTQALFQLLDQQYEIVGICFHASTVI